VAVSLGSNIASLGAQRRLAENTSSLSKTFERLSSGQRINRSSDDAAGLAISDSLRADSRIFNQGIRNFNDGLSLLNIADSAIENLSSITIRLKELAEQSANGTYGTQQRNALDAEAQSLSKEYLRIAQSTTFNGRQLFNGSLGELRLQGGYGTDGGIQSSLGGAIGTGSFGGIISSTLPWGGSDAMAVGDLNGDGFNDVVSGEYLGGGYASLSVRLGRGDGTFYTAQSYSAPNNEVGAISIGDINGDGAADIVIAGDFYDTGYATHATLGGVFFGSGNGTFANAKSFSLSGSETFTDIAIADLDGDGKDEFLVTSLSGNVSVWSGGANGTPTLNATYASESGASNGVTLGDLNGDGILDLVTAGRTGGGTGLVNVRLGTGRGTFGSATSYASATIFSNDVALGDLNNDGILDLVTGGQGGGGKVTVSLGLGNGTFGTTISYAMNTVSTSNISISDLNGDGILDIASGGNNGGSASMAVILGTGNGTFGTATSYSVTGSVLSDLKVADMNNDGVGDLVAGGSTALTIRIGQTVSGVSSIATFSLKSKFESLQALSQFGQVLDRLSSQRGKIGAFQSRANVAINTLQAASENYKAAESRIRDADIASDSSNLVRLNILQQSAASVLGQANQQPALALKLLGK
jgi:flagellin